MPRGAFLPSCGAPHIIATVALCFRSTGFDRSLCGAQCGPQQPFRQRPIVRAIAAVADATSASLAPSATSDDESASPLLLSPEAPAAIAPPPPRALPALARSLECELRALEALLPRKGEKPAAGLPSGGKRRSAEKTKRSDAAVADARGAAQPAASADLRPKAAPARAPSAKPPPGARSPDVAKTLFADGRTPPASPMRVTRSAASPSAKGAAAGAAAGGLGAWPLRSAQQLEEVRRRSPHS